MHEHVSAGDVSFQLTRHRCQRRINIHIRHNGTVIVSAPPSWSKTEIIRQVKAKETWVLTHLHTIRTQLRQLDPLKKILFEGKPHRVIIEAGTWKRGKVIAPRRKESPRDSILDASPLSAGFPSAVQLLQTETPAPVITVCVTDPGNTDFAKKVLEKWLLLQAKDLIVPRAHEISRKIEIPFSSCFIRNQKTRWGSSSSRGNIALNWRIILLPAVIRDYLIIHELCHQSHPNHSREYWKLVEDILPCHAPAKQWLQANSILMGLFRDTY